MDLDVLGQISNSLCARFRAQDFMCTISVNLKMNDPLYTHQNQGWEFELFPGVGVAEPHTVKGMESGF